MTDFKLNPLTGDLDITNGISLVTGQDEAAQRVNLALGLNLGEWFANIDQGLPWIRNNNEDFAGSIRFMLGDKFPDSAQFITFTLDDYLSRQSFIESVSSSYTFNPSTRVYTYTVNIIGIDGVTITIKPFETTL